MSRIKWRDQPKPFASTGRLNAKAQPEGTVKLIPNVRKRTITLALANRNVFPICEVTQIVMLL